MLIVFLWLGSVLPERYTEVISDCEAYPGNRCVLLQEVHEKILLEKYKDLLHLSKLRLDSMIMVQRTDILRLLYLYDKGGIYSDLDNKINYTCLENFIKNNNETFYFGHEQFDPKKPSNNFIYSPTPQHPQIKRVIQKIHQCEQCTDLNFASPYFLNKIGVPFKIVRDCLKHGYQSTWYWTKHKYLKSPQQARWEAQQRERQDKAAAGDPAKMKALAQKRAKEKLQTDKNFQLGQVQADTQKALSDCKAQVKVLNENCGPDCLQKKDELFVALFVVSVAFCGLAMCNLIKCCQKGNKKQRKRRSNHEGVSSADSNRVSSMTTEVEENSNVQIQSGSVERNDDEE